MEKRIRKGYLFLSFFLAVVWLIGCSSQGNEMVLKQISTVEMLINQAKQNDAEKYAPLELKLAEDKLKEARAALEDEEEEMANRKAEEAMMEAKLAGAKAQAEKAKKRAKDEEKDVELLKNELNRTQ